jgi:hypothetical protein
LQPPDAHHVVAPLRNYAHDLHSSLQVRTKQSPGLASQGRSECWCSTVPWSSNPLPSTLQHAEGASSCTGETPSQSQTPVRRDTPGLGEELEVWVEVAGAQPAYKVPLTLLYPG